MRPSIARADIITIKINIDIFIVDSKLLNFCPHSRTYIKIKYTGIQELRPAAVCHVKHTL